MQPAFMLSNNSRYIKDSVWNTYYEKNSISNIFNEFILDRLNGSPRNWGPLINPNMYHKALKEFITYGLFINFPTKYIYLWIGIIVNNTIKLEVNNLLSRRSHIIDFSVFDNSQLNDFIKTQYGIQDILWGEECTAVVTNSFFTRDDIKYNVSKCLHSDDTLQTIINIYNDYNKTPVISADLLVDGIQAQYADNKITIRLHWTTLLEMIGLYDWMRFPDGSAGWTDMRLPHICDILKEYTDKSTPEETLVIINKILDLYHFRGDLASIFIQGGKLSLTQISNCEQINN